MLDFNLYYNPVYSLSLLHQHKNDDKLFLIEQYIKK